MIETINKLSKEERKHLEWEYEIKYKLEKWGGKYFDIEYAIFELVRLYKVFDWENNELVSVGW